MSQRKLDVELREQCGYIICTGDVGNLWPTESVWNT